MFVEIFPAFRETTLPKDACYSFVLQHPENIICVPIAKPRLFLVSITRITPYGILYVDPLEYPAWNFDSASIHFPEILYSTRNVSTQEILAEIESRSDDIDNLGVSLMNLFTGHRHYIGNSVYHRRFTIRKYPMQTILIFLCMLRIGKVYDFIQQFPYYRAKCMLLLDEYNHLITQTHKHYLSHYVQKQSRSGKGISDKIPKKYFTHIYNLHRDFYLPNVRTGYTITRQVVNEYFMAMEPMQLYYILFKVQSSPS
jgi:hypothetical protein